MIELGVNIDHIATVRQARRTYEPDPVWAAVEAHLGGADGITVHLREDRRHIQDDDVRRLRELTHIKLNLEMAATDEMVGVALRVKPEMAMLVPEGRQEVTTEGGLDIAGQEARIRDVIARLAGAGIVTSVFIDAEPRQVEAAARAGARVCEIHTGPYAHAFHSKGRDPGERARRGRARQDPRGRRGDPRARHALQRRARAQLLQRGAGGGASRRAGAAHRARHREPRGLRGHARGRARDEVAHDRRRRARAPEGRGAMIVGVGTDVVSIPRVADALERWGERFVARILTPEERVRYAHTRQKASHLAKRFAAKEAFSKAIGTGIRSPFRWHSVSVGRDARGKPGLVPSADMARHLADTRRHHLAPLAHRRRRRGHGVRRPRRLERQTCDSDR